MRRFLLLTMAAACLAILAAPAVAHAITFEKAVDKLVRQGYPKKVIKKVRSYGTNPLGFRAGGSWADDACARYLAKQMRAAGLKNVRLEPVPVDEWDMKGAHVVVNGRRMPASQFGGVRGTPAKGLSGDLVYVGTGSAAELDAAGDVAGKIVLIDLDAWNWWVNFPQMEATIRGAKAAVFTHAPYDTDPSSEYFSRLNALGCFDAETDYTNIPFVYVSRASGNWLRAELAKGSARAKVVSKAKVTFADQGGRGYNVVGIYPGTSLKRQYVLVSAHHDAWFRPAMDDTSSCAAMLTMARAMKMSGYTPKRTVVFMMYTAEEFGLTNSWYDWLIGSWWAVTETHKDWPGKVAGNVNLEWQGLRGGGMQIRVNPELAPWLERLAVDRADLLPYGLEAGYIRRNVWTWNDQWPLTAAGIPSVYLVTKDGSTYRSQWYHTQYDRMDLIEWPYYAKNVKWAFECVKGFDRGIGRLLPYNFTARADQLGDHLDFAALKADGVPDRLVDDLEADHAAFAAAAKRFDENKGLIPWSQREQVNRKLMAIAKELNSSLTALDAWDFTCYPHDQVQWDVEYLNAAIDALPADPATAEENLWSVGQMYYAQYFSEPVYLRHLQRIKPTYYRVNWGGQGHLAPYPRLTDEVDLIQAARLDEAKTKLIAKRDKHLDVLEDRLHDLRMLLQSVADDLDVLVP